MHANRTLKFSNRGRWAAIVYWQAWRLSVSVGCSSRWGVSSSDGTGWPLLETFWSIQHVAAAAAACRREKSILLADWQLQILGSVHKKRSRTAPWACCFTIHDFTQVVLFLLIFHLCLFVNVICNFLSDMFSISKWGVRKHFCIIVIFFTS